jgi:hypothetical protein
MATVFPNDPDRYLDEGLDDSVAEAVLFSATFRGNRAHRLRVDPSSAASDTRNPRNVTLRRARRRNFEREWEMSSNSKHTLLGMAAVMGLGLLALGATPAAARDKSSDWGWRNKQAAYNRDYRNRNGGYRDGYRDNYGGRYNGRYNGRRNANDIDGDGITNRRDGDMDGDGVANRRDRDLDGDGIGNQSDDYVYSSNRFPRDNGYHYGYNYRNRGRGDTDRDGVRNRRDRDIDGDGRWNWRDRDMDGDHRRNSRVRYDRNPRRR